MLAGCKRQVSDYSEITLVHGAGLVTLDEQPLADAVVTFEDLSDDTFSYATTDKDGRYTLQFDSQMRGVKIGRKIVRISTTRKILGLTSKAGRDENVTEIRGKDRAAEKVPERYNKKSQLAIEVTKRSEPFNFALKSK